MGDREGKMGGIQRGFWRKLQKLDDGLASGWMLGRISSSGMSAITFNRFAEAVASPLEISARTAMEE